MEVDYAKDVYTVEGDHVKDVLCKLFMLKMYCAI